MTIINATRGASKQYVDSQDAKLSKAVQDEAKARQDADTILEGKYTTLNTKVDNNYSTLSTKITNLENVDSSIQSQIGTSSGENDNDATTLGSVSKKVIRIANQYTNEKVSTAYKVMGTCTFEALSQKAYASAPNAPERGQVYNVTDTAYYFDSYTAGGTTYPAGYAYFEDSKYKYQTGANTFNEVPESAINIEKIVPPGTNWVWAESHREAPGNWDAMGGTIDLSAYELTASVDSKLSNYSPTSAINAKLAQHQNLILSIPFSLEASAQNDVQTYTALSRTIDGDQVTVHQYKRKVEGIKANDDRVLIVSPAPGSMNDAVNCGLIATGTEKNWIVFEADTTITSSIGYTVTIIDLAVGIQIS